jgi:hypothetical protein
MITHGSSETKIIPSITNPKLSFTTGKFPKRYPQRRKLPSLELKSPKILLRIKTDILPTQTVEKFHFWPSAC